MKLQQKLLTILSILSLTVFTNCGSDGGSETPPQQVALGDLSNQWSIVSAELDGDDVSADFTGFKLTISGDFDAANPEGPYDFSVTGSQPVLSPWPQTPDNNSGSWNFGSTPSANSGLIARDDGTAITYTISDSGQLTLSFTFGGEGYPAAKVKGAWIFVFN